MKYLYIGLHFSPGEFERKVKIDFPFVQVDSPVEFGDSWKLDTLECSSTPEVPNPCDNDRDKYKQADDLCYILLDRTGRCRHST